MDENGDIKAMLMQLMNHQQALETMAVERYVLQEMTETERGSFEQHFLYCPQCLEAVTVASDFFEIGRDLAVKGNEKPAPAPTHTKSDRVPFWSAWLRPAPAFGLAVFLAVAGFALYQGSELRNIQKIAGTPQVVAASVFLAPIARGADQERGPESTVSVPRNGSLELDFDLPAEHPRYPMYDGQIVDENGSAALPAFSLAADQLNRSPRIQVTVPPLSRSGPYELVIRGFGSPEKEKAVIARYHFVLEFTN